MKASTKRRKQLEKVSEWLAKARPDIQKETLKKGWTAEFDLLIAVEQLVEYLKMVEDDNYALRSSGGTIKEDEIIHKGA